MVPLRDADGRTDERPLLRVRGISKSFGRLRAVDELDFDVRDGEILGIAGPNGAGKSTLFNLLTRVPYGPDSGEVELDGQSLASARPRKIVRAGMVRTFQAEAAFDTLTVLENVRVAAAYGSPGASRERALQMLDLTGLLHCRDEVAGNLSLFAKKKLMLATAMTTQPRLLLLDEPASGLNEREQQELIELIRRISADGVTVIIIEHVLALLHALADRLIILASGRHLAEGRPAEVLRDERVIEAYVGRRTSS